MKTKIIAVAGPTASGKTSLAIEIAKRVGGEVISNDSMQVYRGMEIGTAAPTLEEMDGIVHHMVGVCDPTDEFSCADYAERARRIIDDVAKRGRVPVFCGGTGLYLDAVLSVSDLSESGKDEGVRERLSAFAEKEGNEALHARLRKVDPEAADAIHKNNVRRVIRALEIYETTGITKTEWDRRSKERELPYDVSMAIIEFSDRELLYSRIDRRVEIMMESGLLTEVKALFEKGLLSPDKPAFQAIGYKEFIPYLEGSAPLSECIAAVQQSSRRYAKRQITWFRRYPDAVRLVADCGGNVRSAEEMCSEFLEKSSFMR
ncbi:MAG: tRNA (adenosine(37)-N6)-dimethylallyltransferase MiaA [Ruminococcaceae bacterium]|nr:tRNA (adenosine(37)-N6)-dimethylallyltransferase MiaA [Oscillospiraceae bacterium]